MMKFHFLRVLSDTNFRLQAKHLVVVAPDSMNDQAFENLRSIEKEMFLKIFQSLESEYLETTSQKLLKLKKRLK